MVYKSFYVARSHKFGRQGQAGPEDDEDYSYGYYSGTTNESEYENTQASVQIS